MEAFVSVETNVCVCLVAMQRDTFIWINRLGCKSWQNHSASTAGFSPKLPPRVRPGAYSNRYFQFYKWVHSYPTGASINIYWNLKTVQPVNKRSVSMILLSQNVPYEIPFVLATIAKWNDKAWWSRDWSVTFTTEPSSSVCIIVRWEKSSKNALNTKSLSRA